MSEPKGDIRAIARKRQIELGSETAPEDFRFAQLASQVKSQREAEVVVETRLQAFVIEGEEIRLRHIQTKSTALKKSAMEHHVDTAIHLSEQAKRVSPKIDPKVAKYLEEMQDNLTERDADSQLRFLDLSDRNFGHILTRSLYPEKVVEPPPPPPIIEIKPEEPKRGLFRRIGRALFG
jgi:hypothetical protein